MNGKLIFSVLEHMNFYCNEVDEAFERFGRDYNTFSSDRLFQNAVSMSLMQIGELVGKLPLEFIENNPQIPWKKMRGMRNLFAHAYHTMDKETIWNTANKNIPVLRRFCEEKLGAVDEETVIDEENDDLEI